jgi:hypothetical protein
MRRPHKPGHRKDKAVASTVVRRPKVDLIRMAPPSRVTAPHRKVMALPRKVTALPRKVTAPHPVPVVTALPRKVTGHLQRVMAVHPADRHPTAHRKVPTIPADTRRRPAR